MSFGTMRGATPPPQAIVIFGGTGDLTRRKLVPALLRIFCQGLLPEAFAVVGVAKEELSDDAYRRRMKEAVAEFAPDTDPPAWERFAPHLSYVHADLADPAGYVRLRDRLEEHDREAGTAGNRLFYLAVPPTVVARVVGGLHGAGLEHPPRRGDGSPKKTSFPGLTGDR